MIFRLKTKELFTNDGRLIKKLYCPLEAEWDGMEKNENPTSRTCESCNKKVFDTDLISEEVLFKMVKEDESLCVKVDMDSENIIFDFN
ncbi:hypothetical protein [Nafulsella turpanensis]|uniref:hypothetical protein n=1 Tax=Nafulsella turpanensis TaxID=1265690 RepID=UPI00034A59A5|nr:hypothetical protein [Nafulsella turpanensis]